MSEKEQEQKKDLSPKEMKEVKGGTLPGGFTKPPLAAPVDPITQPVAPGSSKVA